jgi:hypothetical protein
VVDMQVANTAIKRTRHLIPTLESVFMELNGASFFSKLDQCQAYHQLERIPVVLNHERSQPFALSLDSFAIND